MLNEANAALTHGGIAGIIAARLIAEGAPLAREVHLPNGRIADVLYLAPLGTVHIIEIKTELRPSLISATLRKYGHFAHYLWIAYPSNQPPPLDLLNVGARFEITEDRIGLISVSTTELASVRQARMLPISASCAEAARSALRLRLTGGELIPNPKTGTAAEPPINSNASL